MTDPSGPTLDEARSRAPGAEPAARVRRTTSRRVLATDWAAGAIVRVGGVTIIFAVVGILVFLVATVWPLFLPAEVTQTAIAGRVPVAGRVHVLAIDEYRLLAAAVGDAPEVVFFRPDTSEIVARVAVPGFESARVTAARRSPRSGDTILGTADGRVAVLGLRFESDFVIGAEAEALRRETSIGERRTVEGGVLQRRPGGNLLRVRPNADVRATAALPDDASAVVAVGYASNGAGGVAAAATAAGRLVLLRQTADEASVGAQSHVLAPVPLAPGGPHLPSDPLAVLVDEEIREAWVVGRDGAVARLDVRAERPVVREVKLVGEPGETRIAAAELLVGDRSIVLALSDGAVEVWSPAPTAERDVDVPDDPGDGRRIIRLHRLEPTTSPATSVLACPTRRTFYVGHSDGSVTYAYATNERILGRIVAFQGPVAALAAGQRDDGFIVVGPGLGYRGFDVDCPHPEATLAALFLPVHYEGYAGPTHHYESTSATDEAELKLGIWILLFGTLKATFYAMLFALPLALLGALYTAQFMHPRVRGFVKPAVEVMASLPSVVLGFVAGLVLAPAVEKIVPGVFAGVVGVVLVGALAGFAWSLVPPHLRNAVTSAQRLLIAVVLTGATLASSVLLTPVIERLLFSGPANLGGDFRIWLRAEAGTGSGLPLLSLGLFFLGSACGIFLLPRVFRVSLPSAGRTLEGVVKALAYGVLPGVALALLAGPIEHLVFRDGFRWWLVGEAESGTGTVYDQRNSLVVGIAMGFAVIPILYTIAEDALSAIPQALKSAALACGASPWQTAMRVVVPAAAPGVFSAVMIGLGRAVGETMIVLMAAGGTPILDMSIFNGFRTLSANIATELPEAPQGGTLYRVLFLAGLLLFALTFVVNTLAEIVRIRFRRKFKQL
jgi:phosphate transport system permease protein